MRIIVKTLEEAAILLAKVEYSQLIIKVNTKAPAPDRSALISDWLAKRGYLTKYKEGCTHTRMTLSELHKDFSAYCPYAIGRTTLGRALIDMGIHTERVSNMTYYFIIHEGVGTIHEGVGEGQ